MTYFILFTPPEAQIHAKYLNGGTSDDEIYGNFGIVMYNFVKSPQNWIS